MSESESGSSSEGMVKLEGPKLIAQFATGDPEQLQPMDDNDLFIKRTDGFPPHLLIVFDPNNLSRFRFNWHGMSPGMLAQIVFELRMNAEMMRANQWAAEQRAKQNQGIIRPGDRGFQVSPNMD